MKFKNIIATIALLLSSTAFANNQEANTLATSDYAIQTAVAAASKAWKDAFNAGDAAAAAALYEEDAIMVVKPFGTYKGRQAIQSFWENIIENGYKDVIYSNTNTRILDNNSARVSSDWRMNNAQGVITNELWVIQADGTARLKEDHFEIAQ
ncbi:SgcJ/EcaC family oxidoreductase [uncultured Shewanella sp.]|uniref:SgcJ/EcaC family oxidoreductase n=1 Tax=uncultured Shewanella sp. TaxID=173975 RepID=UPI0026104998|nr:SgcJ/EcaC family oxidoreductase [uncultured Shewanella sp.]